MTCGEFRSHLSQGKLSAEAAAHAELCANCRNLAFAEAELGEAFRLLRETAPDPPTSLDASVMTAFRQRMAQPRIAFMSWSLPARFAWAAVATGLVIGFSLFVTFRKAAPVDLPSVARVVTPPVRPAAEQPAAVAAKQSVKLSEPARKRVAAKRRRSATKGKPHVTFATNENSETGFQNLMFCDPISCSGAMQVFRIQLPASDVQPITAWRSPTGFVQADVVVGSDGIARAIRIVK